jgi:O-antigen/teichoic acid export membrane protein
LIRKRIVLAAIANWSARLVEIGVGFLLVPFVLHRVGDTQYGLYVLVGAVIGQGALLDLGIGSAVIKYVAEHRALGDNDRLRSLIATALVLYSCIGLLALLLTVGFAPILPDLFNVPPSERGTATMITLLMGIRLAITIPCKTFGAALWGLHRYGQANSISILSALTSAAATVAILRLGGDLIAMVAAAIPVTIVIQLITVWCVRRAAPELRFSWRGARRGLVKTVFSFSASLSLADIAYNIQAKSDEIIIGAFLPISSVTPYAIARRLGMVPHLLAEQALGSFLPLTSELEAKGDSYRLQSLYLVGSRVTLAICVPLAGILVALAGPVLTLWIGAEYADSAAILMVLALASVVEISHWPGQLILQGLTRHHGLAVAYVCSALAKLGLAVLLVRFFGLIGVALATLLSAAGLSLVYVFPYTMRILRVPLLDLLKQAALPALLPAFPMLALLYGIVWAAKPSGLFLVGATAVAGFATYAIVYLGFCAGDAERKLVRSLLNRIVGYATSSS